MDLREKILDETFNKEDHKLSNCLWNADREAALDAMDSYVKVFLEWLCNEPEFNIDKDDIQEILEDWNFYNKNQLPPHINS